MGYTQLGKISNHRGLKGELVIIKNQTHNINFNDIESIYIHIDGNYVPFSIKETKKINDKKSTILLENQNSREDNEKLIKSDIYIPDKVAAKFLNEEFKIIGYSLIQEKSKVGKIIDFINNKQSIIICDFDGKEVMVPYVKKYFLDIDHKNKLVDVLIPKELINLN